MNRQNLEENIEKAIAKLPTTLEELVDFGKSMEAHSANPDGAVPIRESLDEKVNNGLFYNYSDGAGNSDSLWLVPTADGLQALYLYYDHESQMNFFAEKAGDDYEYQSRLYSDLPLELKELLSDGEEGELLNIKNPEGTGAIYHGSAVLYLNHGVWIAPESYKELAIERDCNGGITYGFDPKAYLDEDFN